MEGEERNRDRINVNKYMEAKLFFCMPWMRCGDVRVQKSSYFSLAMGGIGVRLPPLKRISWWPGERTF